MTLRFSRVVLCAFSFLFVVQTCLLNAGRTKVTREKVIIIPGTWSTGERWYKEGGFFYDTVAHCAAQRGWGISWFSWSAELGYDQCLAAAKELACEIEQDHFQLFHIIAHSRGAHVAAITSQILYSTGSKKRIGSLYMLGAPIDHSSYLPNMHIVDRLYNLYSTADVVQSVFGLYHQCFEPHERTANLRVLLEGMPPDHSQLHNPIIGRYLLNIHTEFASDKVGNFERFVFTKPGVIRFYADKLPLYEEDNPHALHWRRIDDSQSMATELEST